MSYGRRQLESGGAGGCGSAGGGWLDRMGAGQLGASTKDLVFDLLKWREERTKWREEKWCEMAGRKNNEEVGVNIYKRLRLSVRLSVQIPF
jgi:hypothetical protein